MGGRIKSAARKTVALGALFAIATSFGVATVEHAPPVGAAAPSAGALPIGPSRITGTDPLPLNHGTTPSTGESSRIATHLSIVPTFESSVTTSPHASQIESAFNYAIGQFEAEYSNPITVDVNVAFTGSQLGMNSDALFCALSPSYSTFRTALLAHETTPDQITSEEDLPTADPTGGGEMCAPLPEEMALGMLPANCFSTPTCPSGDVPTITIGSSYSYTFDPSNRAVSGDFDFIGVVEHEMSEVLGRMPGLDIDSTFYVPNDLFRYTATGVRSLTQYEAGAYLSIDNGTTPLVDFNTVSPYDPQDYTTATPDSFDAVASPGSEYPITSAGITNMDVLGYDRIPASLTLTPSSSTTEPGVAVDIAARAVDSLSFAIGDVTERDDVLHRSRRIRFFGGCNLHGCGVFGVHPGRLQGDRFRRGCDGIDDLYRRRPPARSADGTRCHPRGRPGRPVVDGSQPRGEPNYLLLGGDDRHHDFDHPLPGRGLRHPAGHECQSHEPHSGRRLLLHGRRDQRGRHRRSLGATHRTAAGTVLPGCPGSDL